MRGSKDLVAPLAVSERAATAVEKIRPREILKILRHPVAVPYLLAVSSMLGQKLQPLRGL